MSEKRTRTPSELIEKEMATDIMGSFRSVAPQREPNKTVYTSYLNGVGDELAKARLKKPRIRNVHAFYVHLNRCLEIYFTSDLITWVWENGENGHATRQFVQFSLVDEKPQLQLTLEKFADREERKKGIPLSSASITITDEETVLLSINGQEERVPMDEALPLFPKPNGHNLTP